MAKAIKLSMVNVIEIVEMPHWFEGTRNVTLALILTLCSTSYGQIDTSLQLISKIDFQEQFELHDGNLIHLMGYTQLISAPIDLPSPTLIFEEGDSVNLSMWNLSQGAPHTIHLHGLDVNQQNDGVPMLSFEVEHDSIENYYFKAPHPGTYIYHCHVSSVLHVQSGMYGMLIVKPKSNPNLTWENGFLFDSEHAWMMSEVDTNWHHDSIINHPHDPMGTMDPILPYYPQHFLINGMSETQLDMAPINGTVGEKIYMRLANIGYYANRVIFPAGMNAEVIASDGRPLPSPFNSDTVDVYPGERFGVLLEADSEFSDVIQVGYVNLNTQILENTQEVDLTISGFIGLDELDAEDQLVYPNPANDEVQLPLSGEWVALDLSGRAIGTLISENNNYNVSGLAVGSYILKNVERSDVSVKITIQR
ncbi:multicopper oxidase domain-containing protein [Crocinitomicaceae bacterium]|nr:multicopper oxidase domain-containing protein [Crocinitomicaceae bacterium]